MDDELYLKYRDGIDAVAIAQNVSIPVAENMVRSICQVRLGLIPPDIVYEGLPEDFPCEEYLKDFLKSEV